MSVLKRKFSKLFLWLVVVFMSTGALACSEKETLTESVKQTYVDTFLKEEFPKATTEDVVITHYLGTYNGSYVAVINDDFHAVFEDYLISVFYKGFDFSYSNGYPIRVWNNGSFYDIVGAHEKNLLTNEDLNGIAELYCGKAGTDRLSRVKRSYLHDIIWKNRPEATIQDVIIKENLGTYSECFVGILYDKGNCLFAEYAVVYEVDGLNFNYSNGYPMLVWTEGNFSSLHEAYESDLLTRSDLERIHFLYWNKDQQTKTES